MARDVSPVALSWFDVVFKLSNIGGWVVVTFWFMGTAAGVIPSRTEHGEEILRQLLQHRHRQEQVFERAASVWLLICQNTGKTTSDLRRCQEIISEALNVESQIEHTRPDAEASPRGR